MDSNLFNANTKSIIRNNAYLKSLALNQASDIGIANPEKYTSMGLTPNHVDNLDEQLAERQSNAAKLFNALNQTVVSEVGLGSVKGFSDMFDFIINGGSVYNDNNYTNPVSAKLKEWQDAYNNNVAPIYVSPGKKWSDFGWWMSNIPSIMSSLTLFLPSKTLSGGLGLLTKFFKIDKTAGKITRAALSSRKGINTTKFMERGNRMLDYGITGFTSRILENYQESNQVYSDMIPIATEELKKMDDETYAKYIEKHKNDLQGVNTESKTEVAKAIAKKSADETFVDDLGNGIFDVLQLYGLRNMKQFMNGRNISKVARWDKLRRKYIGKSPEEIQQILNNRSWYRKVGDGTKDFLYRGKVAFMAEASEGVEEGINFIAQEEGMRYGKVLLDMDIPDETKRERLQHYLVAPSFWESAFWGVVGGVVFNIGASGINRLNRTIEYNKNKKNNKNDKTNEELNTNRQNSTLFLDDWETESRINDIHFSIRNNNKKYELLNRIINKKEDPYHSDPETGQPLTFDLSTEVGKIQQELAKQRALDDYEHSILMNSMFVGNYDLTKGFLVSDEFKESLIQSGYISREEAEERQRSIITKAKELELLYDKNINAIDNAINHTNKNNRLTIPYQYYQMVAFDNMEHEYRANRYKDLINKYGEYTSKIEDNLKDEFKKYNISPQQAVRSYVISDQLSDINAKIADLNKSLSEGRISKEDPTNIVTQSLIKLLEQRRDVLINMIGDVTDDRVYSDEDRSIKANGIALSMLLSSHAFEYSANGIRTANIYNDKYQELDNLITDIIDNTDTAEESLKALNKKFGNNGVIFYNSDEVSEAMNVARTFAEDIFQSMSPTGIVFNLDQYSEKLRDTYVMSTNAEIERAVELSKIALDRDSILRAVHNRHNEGNAQRASFIEYNNEILKSLAKDYRDDVPYGTIGDLLSKGVYDRESLEEIREMMTSKDFNTYQNTIANLNYSKDVNKLLPDLIKKAIDASERDDFLNVQNRENLNYEPKIDEEENLESENNEQIEIEQEQEIITPADDIEREHLEENDAFPNFGLSTENNPIPKPIAGIILSEDSTGRITSAIKLTQIGYAANFDASVPVKVNPNEPNIVELDYLNYIQEDEDFDLSNSIFNVDNLWDIRTPVTNGGVLLTNPIVEINNDGKIKNVINLGIIEHPDKENQIIQEQQLSSTGGVIGGIVEANEDTFGNEDFNDNKPITFNEHLNDIKDELVDEGFIRVGLAAKEGKDFDADEFVRYITDTYKDNLTPEELEEVIAAANDSVTVALADYNVSVKKHVEPIINVIVNSAKLDKEVNKTEKEKLNEQLEKAFYEILKNYAKRAIVEEHNGIRTVSIENLLRYCNDVTNNETLASVLYNKFVTLLETGFEQQIGNRTVTYQIAEYQTSYDKIPTKGQILYKASKEYRNIEQSNANGKTIDIRSILGYKNSSYKADDSTKDKFYEVFNKLKPGDKLDYAPISSRGNRTIVISYKGEALGKIYIPVQNSTHYNGNHRGWKADIPKSNDGSRSKLEQLFKDILINSSNNNDYKKIIDKLNDIFYLKERDENGNFREEFSELTKLVKKAVPNFDDYIITTSKYYNDYTRGAALRNIYSHIRTSSNNMLTKTDTTRAEKQAMLIKEHYRSIEQWFNNLQDSYITADRLFNNPNLHLVADRINQGAVIITDEKHLVNEPGTIGTEHKDKIHLAAASIYQPGIIQLGDGSTITNTAIKGGSTFITIPRIQGEPALIHAYPVLLSSSHIQGPVKEIYDNIKSEFKRRLEDWSNDITKPCDEIFELLDSLTSTKRLGTGKPHNALFKGLKTSTITPKNSNESFKFIEYIEGGQRKLVKLFDKNAYGYASVIQFPGEKAMAFKEPERRKYVLQKFEELLDNHLTINIDYGYLRKDENLSGVAYYKKSGFKIKIPGYKVVTFPSFENFVINNNLIEVTTQSKHGDTNFERLDEGQDNRGNGNITFRITEDDITPPVEDNRDTRDYLKEVEDAINDTSENDNLNEKLANILLSDTKLNLLKSSKLMKRIIPKSIIFADGDAVAGFEIESKTIKLYNSWKTLITEGPEGREEAFRHLIHENIHRKLDELSDSERTNLFESLREIFDKFDAYEETTTNPLDLFFRYKDNDDNLKRYYTDGKINEDGLEDFLCESITRPTLMERLNSIPFKDTIDDKTFGNIKSKNLLQQILSVIAKLFGVNLNRGSLLEKEYKLFKDVALNDDLFNNNLTSTSLQNNQTLLSNSKPENNATSVAKSGKNTQNSGNVGTITDPLVNITPSSNTVKDDVLDELESARLDSSLDNNLIRGNDIITFSQARDVILPKYQKEFDRMKDLSILEITC